MNTHVRSFEDMAQRDYDDCEELSRGELRAGRVSWDYMADTNGTAPTALGVRSEPERCSTAYIKAIVDGETNAMPRWSGEFYHGFRDPPEPAPAYPGRYRSAAIYGLCFVMAVGGFGGLIVYAGKLVGL